MSAFGTGAAGRIAELPEHVRNQIAAGEVVERPASVVKELVENALDAGARELRVDLEEGGATLVRVVDDGAGMGPEDLALAFAPHATSKLRDASDLEHIASLGFRGEALASIGSVARARIVSRPRGAAAGHEVENHGGSVSAVREAGAPLGTTVEVRDLFYNVPARRRFLKRASTELGRALDVLQRLALAHQGVGFVVTHDGRRVFDVEAAMDVRARVRRLFGAELADALVAVAARDGATELSGWLAPPRFARGDTSRQMWFLNGRPLRDKLLVRCLKQATRGLIPDGRQPTAFLSLSMDPARVDVNVHPTKSEVRFRDERPLFGFLAARLREAALGSDLATPGERLLRTAERRLEREAPRLPDPGPLAGTRPPRGELSVRELPGPAFDARDVLRPAPGTRARLEEGAEGAAARATAPAADSGWEARDALAGPFLQVGRTYVLRALPDGFEIVDQHALHERVTYEALLAQARERRVEVQRLLVPALVELSRAEAALLAEHQGALAERGLELAAFGATTLAVHGVPALLASADPEELVRGVLDVLQAERALPAAEELFEHVLHSRACRSSVMAGDALTQDEMRALLERAALLRSDQTCPHGRPTRVRFTLSDLEKAFCRR